MKYLLLALALAITVSCATKKIIVKVDECDKIVDGVILRCAELK